MAPFHTGAKLAIGLAREAVLAMTEVITNTSTFVSTSYTAIDNPGTLIWCGLLNLPFNSTEPDRFERFLTVIWPTTTMTLSTTSQFSTSMSKQKLTTSSELETPAAAEIASKETSSTFLTKSTLPTDYSRPIPSQSTSALLLTTSRAGKTKMVHARFPIDKMRFAT